MNGSTETLSGRGQIDWRDLWNVPGLISLARLVIAVVFPFFAGNQLWAIVLVALGLGSDVLDGWLARRMGLASHTGAVFDGWLDKVFSINVAWTFVVLDQMPGWWMWLWFIREMIQTPMVLWMTGKVYRGEVRTHDSSWVGKGCSVLIGASLLAVALGWTWIAAGLTPLIGVLGVGASVQHLYWELRDCQLVGGRQWMGESSK